MAVFKNQNLNYPLFLNSFCNTGTNSFAQAFLNSLLDAETISKSNFLWASFFKAFLRPSPLKPLNAMSKVSTFRAGRLSTIPFAKMTAPSSPMQFSKKFKCSYSRLGSLAKASAVTTAPLAPTLLTPHLKTSFFNSLKICTPYTTCLQPRYPKFFVATPRSSTYSLLSFCKAAPTYSPPSLRIPLKSRLSLNFFNWVSLPRLSDRLLAPTSVRLLKYMSKSRDWSADIYPSPSATGLIPQAPNLLENKLSSRFLRLDLTDRRYSLREFPKAPVRWSPINTNVRFSNFVKYFSPLRMAVAPSSLSSERMKDSLRLLRFLSLGSAFPVITPAWGALEMASRLRSRLSTVKGILPIANQTPASVTLVLPRFSLIDFNKGSLLEKIDLTTSSPNYDADKLMSAESIVESSKASWKVWTKGEAQSEVSVQLRWRITSCPSTSNL